MPIRNKGGTKTHTGQLDAGMCHDHIDATGKRVNAYPNATRPGYKASPSFPSGDETASTTSGAEIRAGKGRFPRKGGGF